MKRLYIYTDEMKIKVNEVYKKVLIYYHIKYVKINFKANELGYYRVIICFYWFL